MLYSNVTRYDESHYAHGTNNLKLTVCLVHAYKKAGTCVIGVDQINQHVRMYLSCGVACPTMWCVCERETVNVLLSIQVCVAHPENTPDASHDTNSSCRNWLLARHGRMVWRKFMSDSPRCRPIFCRCCALATLDDTLHQSSVVGYTCKTLQ